MDEEEDQPSTPTCLAQKPTTTTATTFSSSIAQKALFLLLFLFLIPFFPSEAPEFLGHTPLNRSWELVHLLLVGIAVSYGLCSWRNADASPHKAHAHLPDMALQVASVFDEEEDALLGFDSDSKTHVWSSRYQRGEPKVVLAGQIHQGEKPLCLPVRSLRSQVPRSKSTQEDKIIDGYLDTEAEKGGEGNDAVRPSPIPWRKIEPSSVSRNPSSSSSSCSSPGSASPSSSLSPAYFQDPRSKAAPKPSPAPPPPPPPPQRPFSASCRSLYPSARFQRKHPPESIVREDPSRSGGREHAPTTSKIPSENEIFLLQPEPVPGTPQAETDSKKKAKKRNGSSRKFIIDSDDDEEGGGSDSEAAAASGSSSDASSSVTEAEEADGNEVDKKADEFIAKFREQIRLQRIESIKRTAAQRRRSN